MNSTLTVPVMKDLFAMLAQSETKMLSAKLYGKKVRIALSNSGNFMYLARNARRRGYMLSDETLANLTDVQPLVNKPISYAEDLIRSLKLRKRFLDKNRHLNLWPTLSKEVEAATEENFKKLLDFKADPKDNYGSLSVSEFARSLGLPTIEHHKTLTLKTAGLSDYWLKQIADAIANKKDFSYSWRKGYDYSFQLKNCDDGEYKGWLSQEFKDCGNGHYWLVISPTQCIFCEND